MAGEAALAMTSVKAAQAILYAFQVAFGIGGYLCPADQSISTLSSIGTFDYIIVGAGSAGSVLARRLSECSGQTVLVLEAGSCLSIESACAGYFTMEPQSYQDYNMTSVDDGYSCQSLQGNSAGLTAGKMYGGSSGLHHMLHVTPAPYDCSKWVDITGNSTFSYDNMLSYFTKSENCTDTEILSKYSSYHGTSGPIKMQRQLSSENDNIIAAYEELGYTSVLDSNNNVTNFIYTSPLLEIGDNLRQSGVVAYLSDIKDRSNLYFLSSATVTKVVLDDSNVATGVEFSYGGETYTLSASKEVILTAGALKTPQLLMLSGIGNSTHLTEMGITTLVNNTYVGENLQDHVAACMVFALEEDTTAASSADPHEFPAPMTCAYGSLDSSQEYPDYQSINLIFPNNSSGLLQLCMNVFKYNTTICQAWYDANINRQVMFTVPSVSHPNSTGRVRLNSTSMDDQPLVYLNLLKDSTDLKTLALTLQSLAEIVNTTYFQSIGAEFVDLGICSDYTFASYEYWECYALTLSSTMWHYSGSCSLGSCLDTSFKVNGVGNLRVADASAMPSLTMANINAGVVSLAELAADIIKTENNLSC